MGILRWLFPSPEDRIKKALGLIEVGEYARARLEVENLEGTKVEAIRQQAGSGLLHLNLELAVAEARAGQHERSTDHLKLAASFTGAGDPAMRAARRQIRELKAEAEPPKPPKDLALARDPEVLHAGPVSPDDVWSLPPDDPRLQYAMALEGYPLELRARLLALGTDFALAVGKTAAGDPKDAVAALGKFIELEPAARWERARAAHAAGELGLASSDLQAFGDQFGHQVLGGVHTAALLSRILGEQRRLPEGLDVLEAALVHEPNHLQLLGARTGLLEGLGRHAEADEAARELVKLAPRDMGLYKLMARCRVRAGKRIEAMQVLESGLKGNCTSGRCGSQKFDVEAGRMLARLYLEDRLDPKRVGELLTRVKGGARERSWMDVYLETLQARNAGDPGALDRARELLGGLGDGDPRHGLVQGAFPALTG
jgi:tetratricopeptide (TPR) repeat protein